MQIFLITKDGRGTEQKSILRGFTTAQEKLSSMGGRGVLVAKNDYVDTKWKGIFFFKLKRS